MILMGVLVGGLWPFMDSIKHGSYRANAALRSDDVSSVCSGNFNGVANYKEKGVMRGMMMRLRASEVQ